MNQNRWVPLKRAIPWAELDKKAQPCFKGHRLPLSNKTLLRTIMIQQLDDLTDIQLGKLLAEHHHYRVFAEISPRHSSPDSWLEKWQECREKLGASTWTKLVVLVIDILEKVPAPVMDAFYVQAEAQSDNGHMEHLPNITRREYDILCEMAKGAAIEEIAEEYYIAKNTVRTHKRNIRRKLGITDLTNRRILLYKKWVERLKPLFE